MEIRKEYQKQARRMGMVLRRIVALLIDVYFWAFAVLLFGFVVRTAAGGNVRVETLLNRCMPFACFACVFFRDCFGGRSIGKRLMKLVVLDIDSLEPAAPGQRALRGFFMLLNWLEVVLLLFSGRTVGDRAARTIVVHRRVLQDAAYAEAKAAVVPAYVAQKRRGTHRKLIVAVIVLAALFVAMAFITQAALNSVKATEEYALAYDHLISSEEFLKSGISEDAVALRGYSYSRKESGGSMTEAREFRFSVGEKQATVLMVTTEDGTSITIP